jgi:hypothetical protein
MVQGDESAFDSLRTAIATNYISELGEASNVTEDTVDAINNALSNIDDLYITGDADFS